MTAARALTLALACVLPLSAMAQWQWIDKGGPKVYSDQSPPPDIPAKNDLEARKKQAEAAEAEKKKAQDAAMAEAKADNCKRAREAKATLDSGIRLSRVNAQGEREILDDNQRAAEGQRLQDIIGRDCA